MNYKEVAMLKEGDKILLRDGKKAIFTGDLRRLAYFANNKVAFLDIHTECDDIDHCVNADNSDSRIHPCYGHKDIVWPAQIVKKI
jgi:hypothetical protein